MNMNWYIIRVAKGQDNRVKNALKEQIQRYKAESQVGDIVIPTEKEVKMKNGKKVTVQTYVKKGIEALTGLKAGQTIQLSGTWENGKVGDTRIRTFAAMGTYSTKAQKAAVVAHTPAPAAAPAPEVASETPVAAAA